MLTAENDSLFRGFSCISVANAIGSFCAPGVCVATPPTLDPPSLRISPPAGEGARLKNQNRLKNR